MCRKDGVRILDAALLLTVRVKSYTHELFVICVGVGSANHCVSGTTGEGADLVSLLLFGVSTCIHCGEGHDW